MCDQNGGAPLVGTPSLTQHTGNQKTPVKIPTQRYRLSHSLWALHLLLPIAISLAILRLSFRKQYWSDASSGTSEILAVFQLVAKAHEILIIYSLSIILLYYLKPRLSSSSGLPFGFFASSYGQYLGKPPIGFSFWSSLASLYKDQKSGSFIFPILILLIAFISLAAGPAAAIALIPQLKRWHSYDLFFFDDPCRGHQGFMPSDVSLYVPKLLFPPEINGTSLLGASCLNGSLQDTSACPYQGVDVLLKNMNWTGANNFTVDAAVERRMISAFRAPDSIDGWGPLFNWEEYVFHPTQFWTTNQLLTEYMAQYVEDSTFTYTFALEAHVSNSRTVPSPIVNVFCIVQDSATFIRNVTNGKFGIREIWDEDTLLTPRATQVEFREFFDSNSQSNLVGFILMENDTHGVGNVSVCGIQAKWAPSDLYLLPSQSADQAMSNFAFTTVSESGSPILIRKEWADALNAFNASTNSTTLAAFIDTGMVTYRSWIDSREEYFSVDECPVVGHNLMLSAAIVNGLASIGQEFAPNITFCRRGSCFQGPFYNSIVGNLITNVTGKVTSNYCQSGEHDKLRKKNLNEAFRSIEAPSKSFRDSHWTEISYPVFIYGYGWSLASKSMKFATVILLLHALIVDNLMSHQVN